MTDIDINQLIGSLRSLRVPGMALALEHWVADPSNADRSSLECVAEIVSQQRNVAASLRAERFRKKAVLPAGLVMATWEPSASRGLAAAKLRHFETLAWLDRRQNLIITGPTQSGKTHLAAGLTQTAVDRGRSAHYARVPELIATLHDHQQAKTLATFLKHLGRYDLLILDEFALERASVEDTYLLRRVVDVRERGNGAMIVISPRSIDEWDGLFADPSAASGVFGRMLRLSHDVELKPWTRKQGRRSVRP